MEVCFTKTPSFFTAHFRQEEVGKRKVKEKYSLVEFDETYLVNTYTGELIDREYYYSRIEKNLDDSRRRAKRTILELVDCNPFTYFGTLTLTDDFLNSHKSDAYDYVLKRFKHIKEFVPDFIYIIVAEYGEHTGRLHFHVMLGGSIEKYIFINEHGYPDIPYLRDRLGFVNLQSIGTSLEDRRNVSLYCSKYITKDSLRLGRSYYHCSRGLKRASKCRVTLPYFVENLYQYLSGCEFDLFSYSFRGTITYSVPLTARTVIFDHICRIFKEIPIHLNVWQSQQYFVDPIEEIYNRKQWRSYLPVLNNFFEGGLIPNVVMS